MSNRPAAGLTQWEGPEICCYPTEAAGSCAVDEVCGLQRHAESTAATELEKCRDLGT